MHILNFNKYDSIFISVSTNYHCYQQCEIAFPHTVFYILFFNWRGHKNWNSSCFSLFLKLVFLLCHFMFLLWFACSRHFLFSFDICWCLSKLVGVIFVFWMFFCHLLCILERFHKFCFPNHCHSHKVPPIFTKS